jgi:hypothetical protein
MSECQIREQEKLADNLLAICSIIRKISTESLFCCPVIRKCEPRHESLALLEVAAFLLRPAAGGFHSLA